jgi:hypothetical protein
VLARRHLRKFTEYTTPGWKPGKIHLAIARQFDRALRGEVDRLMLLCPPQHGKSSLASKRFPAMALGVHRRERDQLARRGVRPRGA